MSNIRNLREPDLETTNQTAASTDFTAETATTLENLCDQRPKLIQDFFNSFEERLQRNKSADDKHGRESSLVATVSDVLWTAAPQAFINEAWAHSSDRGASHLRNNNVAFRSALRQAVVKVAKVNPYVIDDLEDYVRETRLPLDVVLAAQILFYISNRDTRGM